MSDQSKIFNLYEGNLNQSAIASMQQRNNDKNYGKYTPAQGKPSYAKYSVPTTNASKVKGAPFASNGLSGDEGMLIKGFGVIDSSQAGKLLDSLKSDIHKLIDKNVTGAILKSKIDLYTSIIQQIT